MTGCPLPHSSRTARALPVPPALVPSPVCPRCPLSPPPLGGRGGQHHPALFSAAEGYKVMRSAAPLKRAHGGGAALSAGARWERCRVGLSGCLRDGRCSPRSAAAAAAMSREPEIMESQVMWEPDTKRNTHMDRFRAAVASSCGIRLGERWVGAGGRSPGLCSGCRGRQALPPRAGCTVRPIRVPLGSRGRGAQSCGRDALLEPEPQACGAASAGVEVCIDGKGKEPYLSPLPGWMAARAALPVCVRALG